MAEQNKSIGRRLLSIGAIVAIGAVVVGKGLAKLAPVAVVGSTTVSAAVEKDRKICEAVKKSENTTGVLPRKIDESFYWTGYRVDCNTQTIHYKKELQYTSAELLWGSPELAEFQRDHRQVMMKSFCDDMKLPRGWAINDDVYTSDGRLVINVNIRHCNRS